MNKFEKGVVLTAALVGSQLDLQAQTKVISQDERTGNTTTITTTPDGTTVLKATENSGTGTIKVSGKPEGKNVKVTAAMYGTSALNDAPTYQEPLNTTLSVAEFQKIAADVTEKRTTVKEVIKNLPKNEM